MPSSNLRSMISGTLAGLFTIVTAGQATASLIDRYTGHWIAVTSRCEDFHKDGAPTMEVTPTSLNVFELPCQILDVRDVRDGIVIRGQCSARGEDFQASYRLVQKNGNVVEVTPMPNDYDSKELYMRCR